MLTGLAVQYVAQRRARGEIAEQTATAYRSRLLLFASHHSGLDPGRLTRRHVERFLETVGKSASYKRSLLSVIRPFCDWLRERGLLAKNPCAQIKPPRLPKYSPRSMATDDVSSTLVACPDARARLIVLLAVQEGLRRGEVRAVELGDIDERRGTLAVRGKGGRDGITRVVPLSEETSRAIRFYLAEHPAPYGPLIRSYRTGKPISANYVTRIVRQAMEAAGTKLAPYDGRSAHALRHTAALDVLEQSGDLRAVQQMLGHVSLGTTSVYLRAEVSGLRAAMAGRSYAPGS